MRIFISFVVSPNLRIKGIGSAPENGARRLVEPSEANADAVPRRYIAVSADRDSRERELIRCGRS